MENYKSKIKKFVKNFILCLVVLFFISFISTDLEHGGGYIKWVFRFFMACHEDAQAITNTPFASLTIAKLATLVFYICATLILFFVGHSIWSEVRAYFREAEEKERIEDEIKYGGESQLKCAEQIVSMEQAISLTELESLYKFAIENWPKWEKTLSRVYQNRKRWLEENNPHYD